MPQDKSMYAHLTANYVLRASIGIPLSPRVATPSVFGDEHLYSAMDLRQLTCIFAQPIIAHDSWDDT